MVSADLGFPFTVGRAVVHESLLDLQDEEATKILVRVVWASFRSRFLPPVLQRGRRRGTRAVARGGRAAEAIRLR